MTLVCSRRAVSDALHPLWLWKRSPSANGGPGGFPSSHVLGRSSTCCVGPTYRLGSLPSTSTVLSGDDARCFRRISSRSMCSSVLDVDRTTKRRRHSTFQSTFLRPRTHRHDMTRLYHATPRKEILPLIGLGAVLVIGRYSYKALQRMDVEWEEYQWELQQYEKQLSRQGNLEGIVMALDLGTLYTKLATNQTVIVSREGDRAVFNGVWYDRKSTEMDNETSMLRNRAALERFFYPEPDSEPCGVQLPWNALSENDSAAARTTSPKKIVSDSVSSALGETLDRINKTLLRTVVTAPAATSSNGTEPYQTYSDVFASLLTHANSQRPTVILPEPVAAIWGAQSQGFLPEDEMPHTSSASPTTTLVIDVGALLSQISIVRRDVVVASIAVPWGGDDWVKSAVELLLHESPMKLHDARSLSALHVHARAAVLELTSKPRVNVHVPYLFPTPEQHHLDATLSRPVLEQAIQDKILNGLFTSAESHQGILSPHLPPPVDLSSLWTSVLTQVLEDSQLLPTNLDHILVVGGGSKPPAVIPSIQSALFALLGGDASRKLVIPRDPTLTSELTVMGASTMLPSFEYSPELGLQRLH